MYWQESTPREEPKASTRVVDLAFRIRCPAIPMDHAYALSQSIERAIPWFAGEPGAGIHPIRGAESGNGWQRPPEQEGGLIHLSRRVRLILRIPTHRVAECAALSGTILNVANSEVLLGECKVRDVGPASTLFARHVLTTVEEPDQAFMQRALDELAAMRIRVPKLMSGRTVWIDMPRQRLSARSLLLADVSVADSIRIQESGLGEGRNLGCGLFTPHKSIAPVKQFSDE